MNSKRILLSIGILGLGVLNAQTTTENYISVDLPKIAIEDAALLNTLPTYANSRVINYKDGLGRSKQQVSLGASPNGFDLVQPIIYDSLGRILKELNPYASITQNNGSYASNALDEQQNFYLTGSRIAHTDFPYREHSYEASPRRQLLSSESEGEVWHQNSLHAQRQKTISNGSNDIANLSVAINGEIIVNGWLNPFELIGTEVIDENGRKTQAFQNRIGQSIVTRKELEGGWVETYNVYDDKGLLAFVIQPEGAKKIVVDLNNGVQHPASFSYNTYLEGFFFQYSYDSRHRMIAKKIPGADWIDYYYNELEQVILTQDGNQRASNECSFSKYDVDGRVILTGIVNLAYLQSDPTVHLSRVEIQNEIDAHPHLWESRSASNFAQNYGYSNNTFPNQNVDILTVNYYDDYDFDRDGTADVAFVANSFDPIFSTYLGDTHQSASISNVASNRINDFTTKTQSKVLNGPNAGNWITNTIFYDEYGREIQIQNQNYINGQNVIDNYYNFAGELLHSNVNHIGDPDGVGFHTQVNIKTRNEYDHASRLVKSYAQVNQEKPVLMVRNNYNEIGQLIEKNIGSTILGSYLQSIDYSYNPRGWLTHINNCDLSNDNILSEFEDTDYSKTAVAIEDLNMRFEEREENGRLQMMIEIEDLREVELQDDTSGDEREVNGTENYRDIIVTREGNDVATYDEMAALYTDSIYLYMDRFEIPIGSSTAAYYEAAEELMLMELAAKNITSADAIDRMKEQLAKYITATLGNVFYNDDDDDLWGMCIQYNTTSGNFDNSSLYNGNISEIHWKNKFDEEKRGYGFQYDQLERMKQAEYKANHNGAWIADLNNYNEFGISYDANGNIQSLQRTGFNQNNQFGMIDDLLYQYQGNQLTSVHDAVVAGGYGDFDFTDGAFLATEYLYDANGNMITDHNKEVSSITYNHLNLPEHIIFTDGESIQFIYDASGNMHHKITDDANGNLSNSYYDGSFHYGEQELSFINTSEGRIVPPNNGVNNYHRYEYYYRDHQNNMRLAYSDLDGDNKINAQTEVLEIGDYYPFGMRQRGHQDPQWQQIGAANVYTFQGQLKHEDFGLNWSQFKWRNHMPDLGRFFNVDPLSESYSHNSTYAFSENVIIHAIELEGLEKFEIHLKNKLELENSKAHEVLEKSDENIQQGTEETVKTISGFNQGKADAEQIIEVNEQAKEEGASDVERWQAIAGVVANQARRDAAMSFGLGSKGNNSGSKKTTTANKPVNKGTSGGERSGKDFTAKGKAEVISANKAANGGVVVCEGCGVKTVPAKKSTKGVTPPSNETQIDHIHPKSKGGDGSPANGQVLCRGCNRKKADKIP